MLNILLGALPQKILRPRRAFVRVYIVFMRLASRGLQCTGRAATATAKRKRFFVCCKSLENG